MRRYLAIGGIVVGTMLAGSMAASAQPAPAPSECPTASAPADPGDAAAPADPGGPAGSGAPADSGSSSGDETPPGEEPSGAAPADSGDSATGETPNVTETQRDDSSDDAGDASGDAGPGDSGSDDQGSDDQGAGDQGSGDDGSGDQGPGGDTGSGDQGGPSDEKPAADPAATADPGPTPADPCAPGETVPGESTSAGRLLNWGEPNRVDTFDGTSLKSDWNVYDGVGHAGNGRRTSDAFSVKDGIMTITGDSEGNTGGMAWDSGQKYGRWEGRVKAPASDESYNALLLLWPDAENFPVGGEIDFMEMTDHTRQSTNMFLHYGKDNKQVQGDVKIDATEWHNWAVEWAPTHVAAYVDGKEWWRTTDRGILPPGPMHLCIQLDWFPKGGDVQESHMYVDWVKQYALSPGDIAEGAADDAAQLVDDAIAEARSLPGAASGAAGAAAGRATEGLPAAGAAAGATGRIVEGGPDPVLGLVPDPSGAPRGAGLVPNPVRSDG
jgi:hypothetical protein